MYHSVHCIYRYFLVILDIVITQFKRRISHVSKSIQEVTALRCDV